MNYIEWHIGDYLRDAAHLSLLEHGVYRRLLDVYYTREGPIPIDQAARLVGARSKEEREALEAVSAEFFVNDNGGLRHRRCDQEIERYQQKQNSAKRSASARWKKAVDGIGPHNERNANASETHMRTPIERNANAMRTHSDGNAHQTPDTRHQSLKPKPEGGQTTSTAFPREAGADPPARPFEPKIEPGIEPGTVAGRLCGRLKGECSMPDVNPSHAGLLALLDAGHEPQSFVDLATELRDRRGAPPAFAYLLAALRNRAAEAQQQAVAKPRPNGVPSEFRAWRTNDQQAQGLAQHLGVGNARGGESWPEYRARIDAALSSKASAAA